MKYGETDIFDRAKETFNDFAEAMTPQDIAFIGRILSQDDNKFEITIVESTLADMIGENMEIFANGFLDTKEKKKDFQVFMGNQKSLVGLKN